MLITNASLLHRPNVQRGLLILDENQGEIWAKLDAGTAEYFQEIEQTSIPFRRILDNISAVATVRPIVLQSLFLRLRDMPPSVAEIEAYCERIREILAAGGKIDRIQIYTVARPPAESSVTPLSNEEVDAISNRVRERCGIPVEAFYGKHAVRSA